jgi:integrase
MKTITANQLRRIADDGLPLVARTRSGIKFNPNDDVWSYRDGVTDVRLDWNDLRSFSPQHRFSSKATMCWYAANGAPSSLRAYFMALREWAVVNKNPAFTPQEFFRMRSAHDGTRLVLQVKGFLRRWSRLGYPGLAKDFVKALSSTRERSPHKGVAVATMDPLLGPFTDVELQAILSALAQAYALQKVSPRDHVLAWLFIALGARPVQLAAMKVKDVHKRDTGGGNFRYDIDVPRGKQRRALRTEMKNRPLTSQVGQAVYDYAQAVKVQFVGKLLDPNESALFPQFETAAGAWAPGFEFHPTPVNLRAMIRRGVSVLEVKSERTGEQLNMAPIRFRRTLGTRAAEEGHGPLVIAELLDHSDLQSVGVYVANGPAMAQRIDKGLALELAPLAQAFKGKLVRSRSEATRGAEPEARIRDLRFGDKDEGYCGQHSFCGFNAPIACYTCNSFEPWADGPHEVVLEFLLSKRERQLEGGESRIAKTNDLTILAVAQVVRLCDEWRRASGV